MDVHGTYTYLSESGLESASVESPILPVVVADGRAQVPPRSQLQDQPHGVKGHAEQGEYVGVVQLVHHAGLHTGVLVDLPASSLVLQSWDAAVHGGMSGLQLLHCNLH